ncbi:MAG: thioredoxin family protein [Candidatus Sericytochromatia bacterium]
MKDPLRPALITTAVLALGLAAVSFFPRQQPSASSHTSSPSEAGAGVQTVAWNSYDKGLSQAQDSKKFVMVQFFATWCGYCKKMDREVLTEQKVQDSLKRYFVPVRVTESSDNRVQYQGNSVTEKELTVLHKVQGFPTMLFLEPDGTMIGQIPGYISAEEMDGMLNFIGSGSYKQMDYASYKAKHRS